MRLFFYGIIGVGSTTLDVPLNVFIGRPISADVVAFMSIKGILCEVAPKGGIFVTPMETSFQVVVGSYVKNQALEFSSGI